MIETGVRAIDLINENKSLKTQIELLEKAVDFYADKDNWEPDEDYDFIKIKQVDEERVITDQVENITVYDFVGGKLARQTKQELEKMRKG